LVAACTSRVVYIINLIKEKRMTEKIVTNHSAEKRSDGRKLAARSHSVEIRLTGVPIHQFKIRDTSSNGMCILVKEDSSILKHLKFGQFVNMKYYSTNKLNPIIVLKAEIKHITKANQGPYRGHYLVGLSTSKKLNLSFSE